jgi:type I site-specific restriction-modification system R (restriction) subunit
MTVNEDTVEQAAIEWFEELGYAYLAGPSIAPGEPGAERDSCSEVVLQRWLTDAIARLNPAMPADAREDALRKVLRVLDRSPPTGSGSRSGERSTGRLRRGRARWNSGLLCRACSRSSDSSTSSGIS